MTRLSEYNCPHCGETMYFDPNSVASKRIRGIHNVVCPNLPLKERFIQRLRRNERRG